jgi:hypothetical protein
VNRELKQYMRKLGTKGGLVAARNMTKEQRQERARKAGLARQARARQGREN